MPTLMEFSKIECHFVNPLLCALHQGVVNMKHEKLLFMKVTYKAYKLIPDQSVN